MTELPAPVRWPLCACTEAMSRRQDDRSIDLFPLNREFPKLKDAIVVFLAEEVERATLGRLTVRRADPALFAEHGKGNGLYLAVCLAADAPDLVTELTGEVTLYALGPFDNGLSQERAATPQKVAEYRAWVAEREQEEQRRKESEQLACAFMTALLEGVRRLAAATRDAGLRKQLERLIPANPDNFKLEQAATACVVTGTDFSEFVFDCLAASNPV